MVKIEYNIILISCWCNCCDPTSTFQSFFKKIKFWISFIGRPICCSRYEWMCCTVQFIMMHTLLTIQTQKLVIISWSWHVNNTGANYSQCREAGSQQWQEFYNNSYWRKLIPEWQDINLFWTCWFKLTLAEIQFSLADLNLR